MIDRIAAVAQDQSIHHVLVAGDVWDKEEPTPQTIRQPLDIMAKHDKITWWLLPGNHDPIRAERLWSRISEIASDNTRPLLEAEPVEMASGVYILPAPWTSKQPGRDLTEDFNTMETPEGAIRIGLAHGGTTDFSGDAPNSAAIGPDRANVSRLDYLALGDWHGKKQINERTWYSGAPEADRFRRNDPGYCLSVSLEDSNSLPIVTPHKTGLFDWKIMDVDCVQGMDIGAVLATVFSDATAAHQTLIQLIVKGQLTVSERHLLQQLTDEVAERAAHLDLRVGNLETLITDEDLDALDLGGSVRLSAEKLNEIKNADTVDALAKDRAKRALDLLFTIAAEQGGMST